MNDRINTAISALLENPTKLPDGYSMFSTDLNHDQTQHHATQP